MSECERRRVQCLLEQALIASVCLEKYPKSVLNVYVVILQNDGNALGAAGHGIVYVLSYGRC